MNILEITINNNKHKKPSDQSIITDLNLVCNTFPLSSKDIITLITYLTKGKKNSIFVKQFESSATLLNHLSKHNTPINTLNLDKLLSIIPFTNHYIFDNSFDWIETLITNKYPFTYQQKQQILKLDIRNMYPLLLQDPQFSQHDVEYLLGTYSYIHLILTNPIPFIDSLKEHNLKLTSKSFQIAISTITYSNLPQLLSIFIPHFYTSANPNEDLFKILKKNFQFCPTSTFKEILSFFPDHQLNLSTLPSFPIATQLLLLNTNSLIVPSNVITDDHIINIIPRIFANSSVLKTLLTIYTSHLTQPNLPSILSALKTTLTYSISSFLIFNLIPSRSQKFPQCLHN